MNSYDLSRKWFDFCFLNPDKIKPNHTALYFFAIEHCNRLGWKQKFGFPTTMVMEALGIKSYNTYINTLNEIVGWGFIEMIERSKNQYSANIIALSNFDKALDKALDKAFIKHDTKQSESIDSIDKQINKKTIKLINNNVKLVNDYLQDWISKEIGLPEIKHYRKFAHLKLSFEEFDKLKEKHTQIEIDDCLDSIENYKKNTSYKSLYLTLNKWLKKDKSSEKNPTTLEDQFKHLQ